MELSEGSGWSLLELAYTYAVAGNRAESDRIVNAVTARSGQFSPYDMATICSGMAGCRLRDAVVGKSGSTSAQWMSS